MRLFAPHMQIVRHAMPLGVSGRVTGVSGLTISVADFAVPVGAACRIERAGTFVGGRVVGFDGPRTLVMPTGSTAGISRGDRVVCRSASETVGVGRAMLGRVLNALGEPIDGGGEVRTDGRRPIWPEPIDPMQRARIDEPVSTGIRVIDSLLTVGRGQRMSILSGAGVGKSVLLGMISRYTRADVTVIALVGERGREVRDFLEKDLGPEGLKNAVVVVATGDESPLLRVQAGGVATAIAEYFRDEGCDVMLLMDSLTRLATAQRQIGLVAGEPPTTKGFTPSVFNMLPELLERSGRTQTGSITGFYTVLVEGDDMTEPVTDAVRSITDGHIHLSRTLANRGQYPAVDVLESVSRVMIDVAESEHLTAARRLNEMLAVHAEIEDLVNLGAYAAGSNPQCDLAVMAQPWIRQFCRQEIDQRCDLDQARTELVALARRIDTARPAAGRTVATAEAR